MTVTKATITITSTSTKGTFLKILKLAHSKVPTATINITPTKAAMGICSIHEDPYRINIIKLTEATMPDSRNPPPELTLMILWPIIAQPPIPPKKPVVILATPWAKHSLLPLPLESVISSTTDKVSRLSSRPTMAITIEKGNMIVKVSQFRGTTGKWNSGSPPPMEAISPTVLVSNPPKITTAEMTRIATKDEGTALVIFGKK